MELFRPLQQFAIRVAKSFPYFPFSFLQLFPNYCGPLISFLHNTEEKINIAIKIIFLYDASCFLKQLVFLRKINDKKTARPDLLA